MFAIVAPPALEHFLTWRPSPTVLPPAGDGIGPEIVGAAKQCIKATGVNIDWVDMEMVRQAEPQPRPFLEAAAIGPP